MKKLIYLSLALVFSAQAFAQKNQIRFLDLNKNWMRIENPSTEDPKELISLFSEELKLSENDYLVLYRSNEDKLRMKHYRFQQYKDAVKVEGAQLLVHIDEDKTALINGRLVKGITTSAYNQLSEESALSKALEFIGAEHYLWEYPEEETLLKELKNDPNATYFPTGELVFADKEYSQDGSKYSLNWKFEIYAKGEKMRNFVYVNAMDGSISFSISGIYTDAAYGTALTRYNGLQNIITDSTGASNQGFILYDPIRNVKTRNMQEGTDQTAAIEFTDEDNYWDNANDAMDDAAGDAHWGMEMTYDYFFNEHGRDSYNGSGAQIRGYIHYDENYFNAFWNGTSLNFGDGNNNPLTSIDVVGHEFAHGVTGNTANLVYQDESGALNESFSDIFGTAIEFYALGEEANWAMGEANFHFRDMDDPNNYDQPDTYHGDFWYSGADDNGGVHRNSGVQNYWFYLLSVGGSGVNDNGTPFEVEGIGMEKAAAISYLNLAEYLTESDNYQSARLGSIAAAAELYGECSEEVRQTLKAWYAVGLGSTDFFFDGEMDIVLPESGCFLDQEPMEIIFIYNELYGCESALSEGDTVKIGYSDNGGAPVLEDIILTENMEVWDEIYYEGTIDLSQYGDHEIEVLFYVNGDKVEFNTTNQYKTIANKVTFESGSNVGFESYEFSPDSFYVEMGEHADAKISSLADNTGTKGFKMTGKDVDINNITWPDNEDQNFTLNPEYNSRICFCVDASDWNEVNLAFDLKQFHSEYWNELYGEDRTDFVSSLRLLIDDEQIGEQYHPTSYTDDPYLTHYVDLDQFAGSIFEACFESKNFVRNEEDPVPGSNGDNSYLDNIRFGYGIVGVEEYSQNDFSVYPNPSNGNITIDLMDLQGDFQIQIIDALGKLVYLKNERSSSNNTFDITLPELNHGMYFLKLVYENRTLSKKIILQ